MDNDKPTEKADATKCPSCGDRMGHCQRLEEVLANIAQMARMASHPATPTLMDGINEEYARMLDKTKAVDEENRRLEAALRVSEEHQARLRGALEESITAAKIDYEHLSAQLKEGREYLLAHKAEIERLGAVKKGLSVDLEAARSEAANLKGQNLDYRGRMCDLRGSNIQLRAIQERLLAQIGVMVERLDQSTQALRGCRMDCITEGAKTERLDKLCEGNEAFLESLV